MAFWSQKWLLKKFTSGVNFGWVHDRNCAMLLSFRWSSWLHPHTGMAQTQICPSVPFTHCFTVAFPSSADFTVLPHVVQKHQVVCHGSSATVCLPRTQIKDLRVHCYFQSLWGPGLPNGLLEASRNSREDLQIWTLILSKRKGRKFGLVNPLYCF